MKSIKLFIILFIVPLILSDEDNFSIDPFIEELKNEGLFNIIASIKQYFGQDIAIISCEELYPNNSGNCKRLVLDYIPDYRRALPPDFEELSPESIKSEIKETIKNILNEKFTIEESSQIVHNIVSKINMSVLEL